MGLISQLPITEHMAKGQNHSSFYLACGAADAPLIIFVHGWPELSISWRHQLPLFATLGFRAIAPDMRGYGRSTIHSRHEDYALENTVSDMLHLLDSLGRDRALWVGHDWGSPVVWSLASHHPVRCAGVANLCVPYFPKGFSPHGVMPLVDRAIYPEEQFPAGQWDYQLDYEENFERARAGFEADVGSTVRALFRRGDPAHVERPARTATIRRDGGWFGGLGRAPDVPMDSTVLTDVDYCAYVSALERNGFFGPDSWYMNAAPNTAYAIKAVENGRLSLPVLFLHAAYDAVCQTVNSRLADPMRASCANLTEVIVQSGHWMAQEQPVAVNRALVKFIADKLPELLG
ncbi:Pimeloyl-ACP methyl ester carboxylesterase [Rhizobiales bacterium GAS188]|nr:Pimeloyl-ACP methyl ester carboxylesterase [Rhizobiales bacterium GAS188]